jgi:hypothetical protein
LDAPVTSAKLSSRAIATLDGGLFPRAGFSGFYVALRQTFVRRCHVMLAVATATGAVSAILSQADEGGQSKKQ